jgi:hypothetical protein
MLPIRIKTKHMCKAVARCRARSFENRRSLANVPSPAKQTETRMHANKLLKKYVATIATTINQNPDIRVLTQQFPNGLQQYDTGIVGGHQNDEPKRPLQ